jgi:hypothetical protein
MNNCCAKTVPHADSSFETFAVLVADWQARLTAGLSRSVRASDENLGHMEEEILQQAQDLERKLLEVAAQKKADASPPVYPVCGQKLSRQTRDHERTFHSRFGPVTVQRLRGWCRCCRAWRFPADQALGLSETGGASPSVQEMAAVTVSKMPVQEASAVIERLTGVKLPGPRHAGSESAAAGAAGQPEARPTRRGNVRWPGCRTKVAAAGGADGDAGEDEVHLNDH